MPSSDLMVLSVEEKIAKTGSPYLGLKVRLERDHPLMKKVDGSLPAKIWAPAIKADKAASNRLFRVNNSK